jgi:hypothetical protein
MKTGYEISLKDFIRLCSDRRNEVAPLIQNWFGYEVVPVDHSFLLRDGSGVEVSPEIVHEMIQADPDRQGTIYRVAMTLWR